MPILIPTTTITTINEPDIEIFTFYDPNMDVLPNTIFTILADNVGSINGVSYIEGQLLIGMKNHPHDIDYDINSNGELIAYTLGEGDADRYDIDANGDLTYTLP